MRAHGGVGTQGGEGAPGPPREEGICDLGSEGVCELLLVFVLVSPVRFTACQTYAYKFSHFSQLSAARSAVQPAGRAARGIIPGRRGDFQVSSVLAPSS